jgi:uncharacterized protein (DUF4213/DUF364 family)
VRCKKGRQEKVTDTEAAVPILLQSRERLWELARAHNLLDKDVNVFVKVLSPEEAIGKPGRRDFPIVMGKERVIEAEFEGATAHVFTDTPKEYLGKLREIVDLPLVTGRERALFIAAMNATLKHLKVVQSTLHCRDNEPEDCAKRICARIKEEHDVREVGLIGLNPAILEGLGNAFGTDHVRLTDLNTGNIGAEKYGIEVWDGNGMTEELVGSSDLVLMTGTTLVNGTFDEIWKAVVRYKKKYLIYGVTCAGICALAGLERVCPYGRA